MKLAEVGANLPHPHLEIERDGHTDVIHGPELDAFYMLGYNRRIRTTKDDVAGQCREAADRVLALAARIRQARGV